MNARARCRRQETETDRPEKWFIERMNVSWGHLVWAVVVGALLTSAVVVMGTFGLVSRPLSDFTVLLFLRLALVSGAASLVFNRVSFRQGRVEARRPSEPDRGFARSAAISTEWDRSPLHQQRVGSYTRQTRRFGGSTSA